MLFVAKSGAECDGTHFRNRHKLYLRIIVSVVKRTEMFIYVRITVNI
jgi:hypothetical protein